LQIKMALTTPLGQQLALRQYGAEQNDLERAGHCSVAVTRFVRCKIMFCTWNPCRPQFSWVILSSFC